MRNKITVLEAGNQKVCLQRGYALRRGTVIFKLQLEADALSLSKCQSLMRYWKKTVAKAEIHLRKALEIQKET